MVSLKDAMRRVPMGRVDNLNALITVGMAYAAGRGVLPFELYPFMFLFLAMMLLRLIARWNSAV